MTIRKNSEDCLRAFHTDCRLLEAQLQKSRFLVGEQMTLADFFVVGTLVFAVMVFHKVLRVQYPRLMEWFGEVYELPLFKDVAGELHLLDVPFPTLPVEDGKEVEESKSVENGVNGKEVEESKSVENRVNGEEVESKSVENGVNGEEVEESKSVENGVNGKEVDEIKSVENGVNGTFGDGKKAEETKPMENGVNEEEFKETKSVEKGVNGTVRKSIFLETTPFLTAPFCH